MIQKVRKRGLKYACGQTFGWFLTHSPLSKIPLEHYIYLSLTLCFCINIIRKMMIMWISRKKKSNILSNPRPSHITDKHLSQLHHRLNVI